MKKKYNWLLIDLDHTLFDFDRAETEALSHFFSAFCGESRPDMFKVYHQINKALWKAVECGEINPLDVNDLRIKETMTRLNIKADFTFASQRYLYYLGEASYLYDGAFEFIKALLRQYNVSAITNGIASVKRRHLEKSQLGQMFKHIFISTEMGISKPNKAYFDIVLDKIGAAEKECLIIGDSLTSDILGGINSGIDTCWYNPTNKHTNTIQPIYYASCYEDILSLLDLA